MNSYNDILSRLTAGFTESNPVGEQEGRDRPQLPRRLHQRPGRRPLDPGRVTCQSRAPLPAPIAPARAATGTAGHHMPAALDHAVRSGRLRSNPARGLGLPRPERRDYVYLTHGQVLALTAEAGRGRLLILLLAFTGLRWGEATALRVCDIDLDRRRVDVRRAFSDVGGRVILGTPKSHQSRTVPLPRFLASEIEAVVVGKRADQLVFTAPGGSVMRLPNWRRSVFIPACRRAGLSGRFRVHALRHTAASLMVQTGYPPKMLQEIMGHASITTTLDLYGHLYPGEMDRYADRLDDAATNDDAAKMRPDDDEDEHDEE